MAYTYYIIRLDFEDGNWGYARWDTGGKFSLSDDPDDCLVFDSKEEATNYYYENFGSSITVNGSRLKKVGISTIKSNYPM